MNDEFLNQSQKKLYDSIKKIYRKVSLTIDEKFNRSVSFGDIFNDRWERAKSLNFGENSSVYDNVLVIGNVSVGKDVWVGPNVILDGSGNLNIGDHCTISSGVHIYTHDNIKKTLLPSKYEIERDRVNIDNNCYIGPNSIISKGVNISSYCIIAANSFVNKSFDSYSIIAGTPAKKIGHVLISKNKIEFKYD